MTSNKRRITARRNPPPTTREVLSIPFATFCRGLPLRRLSLLLLGAQRLYMAPPIYIEAGFQTAAPPYATNGTEYAGAREVCKACAYRG